MQQEHRIQNRTSVHYSVTGRTTTSNSRRSKPLPIECDISRSLRMQTTTQCVSYNHSPPVDPNQEWNSASTSVVRNSRCLSSASVADARTVDLCATSGAIGGLWVVVWGGERSSCLEARSLGSSLAWRKEEGRAGASQEEVVRDEESQEGGMYGVASRKWCWKRLGLFGSVSLDVRVAAGERSQRGAPVGDKSGG